MSSTLSHQVSTSGALSPGQERLWISHLLNDDPSLLNISVAHWFEEGLDRNLFERAVLEMICRHESLRTSFHTIDGHSVQKVLSSPDWAIRRVDLTHASADDWKVQGRELAATEARVPFDVTRAPLVRGLVVHGPQRRTLAVLTVHHLVCDRWSLGIMSAEIGEIYARLCNGEPLALSTIPKQYLSYTDWQREWVSSESVQQELAFWKNHLTGSQALSLPWLDGGRQATTRTRGNAWRSNSTKVCSTHCAS